MSSLTAQPSSVGRAHLASNWASFSSPEPRLAHVFPSAAAPAMCFHDLKKTTRLSHCAPLLPTIPSVSNGSSPFRLSRLAFRTQLIFFPRLTCFPCASVGTHHIIIIFDDNAPHNCTVNFLREPPCQTETVFPCLCMAQFTYSFNDYVLCGSHETLSCYVLTQLIILAGTINNRKIKTKTTLCQKES